MQYTTAVALSGMRSIVTGASSGVGAAVARDLAAAGARVMVNCYKDQEAGAAVAEEIHQTGGEALFECADVSSEADVARLFTRTCREFGGLDLLVNNAGIQQNASATDMTLAQWKRVIDVNLTGQFLCSREAAQEFLRAGREPGSTRCRGNIICMSSVHETIPWAGTSITPRPRAV
jgi:glucose 1-dehydrogenase